MVGASAIDEVFLFFIRTRLVHDRELQLHDGTRLLRHDRYDELLATGITKEELEESGVKRIHPAFR